MLYPRYQQEPRSLSLFKLKQILLEAHMGKFVLAYLKLSTTGHGEDAYRYFEVLRVFPV